MVDSRTFQAEHNLTETRLRIEHLEADLARLREALEFYADPETYIAIGFLPDPPCGAFIEDFGETGTEGYGPRPGERARTALADPGTEEPTICPACGSGDRKPSRWWHDQTHAWFTCKNSFHRGTERTEGRMSLSATTDRRTMTDRLPSPEKMRDRCERGKRLADQLWSMFDELARFYEESYERGLQSRSAGSLAVAHNRFQVSDPTYDAFSNGKLRELRSAAARAAWSAEKSIEWSDFHVRTLFALLVDDPEMMPERPTNGHREPFRNLEQPSRAVRAT